MAHSQRPLADMHAIPPVKAPNLVVGDFPRPPASGRDAAEITDGEGSGFPPARERVVRELYPTGKPSQSFFCPRLT